MEKITIDVGGFLYCTTSQTLRKFPFFAALKDGDFIDRDGTYFQYILNAMRGSSIVPPDPHVAEHIREEAYYYGLTDYAHTIRRR